MRSLGSAVERESFKSRAGKRGPCSNEPLKKKKKKKGIKSIWKTGEGE